jgi:hypothetical protein
MTKTPDHWKSANYQLQITNYQSPDWRLAAELGKINFGLEFQAFAVVSTSLLLIPK